MAKFLLVWEVGANLGHISVLLPIANALREEGHQVTMVLKEFGNLSIAQQFPCKPAPQIVQKPRTDRPLLSYADMLLQLGYDQASPLLGAVRAWRSLFEQENPDIVVFNAAPTAVLAARGFPFKKVLYGNGFDLPPLTIPLPSFRSWAPTPTPKLLEIERLVLSSINQVLTQIGQPALSQLVEIFQADQRLLCTTKELDHYPTRMREKYWGWKVATDIGQEVSWLGGAKYRVFAYLRLTEPTLRAVRQQCNDPDCEYMLYVPGTRQSLCDELTSGNIRVVNQPVKLDQVMKDCSLAVCHSGMGTTTAFLLHGIPIIALPVQLEQFMIARQVANQGLGLMCNVQDPNFNLTKPIKQILSEGKWRKNSRNFEKKYATSCNDKLIPALIDQMTTLLTPASQNQ